MTSQVLLPTPRTGKPEITMAPLVDVIFLLLIFFMVTTVFPKESGLMIEKPASEFSAPLDDNHIVIKLGHDGRVEYKNNLVTSETLGILLKRDLLTRPNTTVTINADKLATTESLIQVIDISKSSGATQLGIATDEKSDQ